MQNLYAVILAGGSGTRMWPRSRVNSPKQFLDLVSDESMLQQTVNRVRPLIPIERICIMAGAHHADTIRQHLPDLPANNMFIEPLAKGTGSCVALAAEYLRRRDPNAVMASLHADHFIRDEEAFRQALRASYLVAEQGLLVTMGARPTYPETGYGYIERGEPVEPVERLTPYRITRFREKPDRATAQQMLDSGRYDWNTGMFTWRCDVIMAAFTHWMPDFAQQMRTIVAAFDTPQEQETLQRVWVQVKNETIDRGIMEHADNAAVIPIDMGWSDIGSWATLHDLLDADTNGNVIRGEHLTIDTHNSLIQSNGKLIATIGLRNIIVVETEDAILICPKERAQDVKDIVEQLKKRQRTDLV